MNFGRLVPILLIACFSIAIFGGNVNAAGPPTINAKSDSQKELKDRIKLLEKYVKFRRSYVALDYEINYQNNGGGFVPGPSDWDIRLIAEVPEKEIDDWIPAKSEKSQSSAPKWLTDLPGRIKRDEISEWHRKGNIVVGIDRERSIIAYRNTSNSD